MTREITLTRRIAADAATVFSFWTEPALIARWYAPVDGWVVGDAQITPGVGGGYVIRFGPAPAGDEYTESATYTAFDPSRLLEWESVVEGEEMSDASRTRVTLDDDGDGTLVTVTETGLDEEAAESHQDGWTWILGRLDAAASAA